MHRISTKTKSGLNLSVFIRVNDLPKLLMEEKKSFFCEVWKGFTLTIIIIIIVMFNLGTLLVFLNGSLKKFWRALGPFSGCMLLLFSK